MRLSEMLARIEPDERVLGGPYELAENEEEWRRFHEGLTPVPPSEQIGPMHKLPGRRPMTPEELRQIDWPWLGESA